MADDGVEEPRGDLLVPEPVGDVQVVRTGRGRLKWAAAFLGIIAVIVGIVVVVGDDDEVDADKALAKAKHIVETSQSYRFEELTSQRTQSGDPNGAGSDTTTRSLVRGEVSDPEHWHVSTDDEYDDESDETIRMGDTEYTTGFSAADDPNVKVPQWTVGPAGIPPTIDQLADLYALPDEKPFPDIPDDDFAEMQAQQHLDLAITSYLLPVEQDPANVKRLVEDATDPVVEEQLADGGVRLRTRLAPIAELAKKSDTPIPPVDLLLILDSAGRPTTARFTGSVDGSSEQVEMRYSGWGDAITIAPPSDGDVDHTPWIDEELLAAHPEVLAVPTDLPDGWFLVDASVYRGPSGFGPGSAEDDCWTLQLGYATERDLDEWERVDGVAEPPGVPDYLSASVDSPSCAEQADELMGGVDAVVGEGGGDQPPTLHRTATVDGRAVAVDTTIQDQATVDRMARSVRPTTVADLDGQVPQRAKDIAVKASTGGGFFPY